MRISDWSSDVCSSDLEAGYQEYDKGLAVLILKTIGVYGIEAKTEHGRLFAQRRIVADLVPWQMGADARRCARELIDDGTILQLFVNRRRFAGKRKFCEACATAPRAPARYRNGKARNARLDGVDRHALPIGRAHV